MFNIKDEIEKHKDLINVKATSNPELFVIKYKTKVFFDDLWDDFLRNCRGLVIDKDYNIVTLPFDKIHNFRKENGAPEWTDDMEVAVARKVNGFMVAATTYKGELIVSTTGSIDSDFVKLARSHITPELEHFINHVLNASLGEINMNTVLFECVDVSDPHIVPETPGLYFLGMRENVFGSKIAYTPNSLYWNELGVMTLPVEYKTVGEVLYDLKTCRHEGFVMYRENDDGTQSATKLKSPHYLIKKLFMRGNLDRLLGKNIRENIDEEYYELLDAILEIKEEFSEMSEMSRRDWIERYFNYTEFKRYE